MVTMADGSKTGKLHLQWGFSYGSTSQRIRKKNLIEYLTDTGFLRGVGGSTLESLRLKRMTTSVIVGHNSCGVEGLLCKSPRGCTVTGSRCSKIRLRTDGTPTVSVRS